jgi:protein-tyrosine phosphatase
MTGAATVLFVCTGNYYRSRYAELLFNATRPHSLPWLAASRGFDPSPFNPGAIASSVVARMQSRGLPPPDPRQHPIRLTEADLSAAARIIALDAREHEPYVRNWFPDWRGQFEYWRVPDLDRMGVDEALGLIEANVAYLVAALTSERSDQP